MPNISFLGNYTIDIIADYYKRVSKENSIFICDYNQYHLNFLKEDSKYQQFQSDFSILLLDGDTLLKDFKNLSNIKKHINEVINIFLKNHRGYLIISNIYLDSAVNRIQFYNNKNNIKYLQHQLNNFLNNFANKEQRLHILDLVSLIETNGLKNMHDNPMWYYGKVRFNSFGSQLLALQIKSLINAISNKSKKCLILDLDNTLWGGIIGEDGIDGINLGVDGIGEVYYSLQKKIKQIKQKGIVLAICSKNNENDAKEVFYNHKYCPLKWNDFVIKKVNWQTKDINIKQIARELNIGEDNMVFVDDSPVEREIISKNTAAVAPNFPDDPSNLGNFIDEVDLQYFSKLQNTKEDKQKTLQYKQNITRAQIETNFNNIDSFIKTLKIKLTIFKNNPKDIARIAQLTQKTNQFNFTTKRYSELEIEKFIKSKNYEVFLGQVEDKFGDYGKVIICILEKEGENYKIDNFLMSCRVIGRKIENYFINSILGDLVYDGKIFATYKPTAKNIVVKDKYEEMGFKKISTGKQGNKFYILEKKAKLDNLIDIKYEK